MKIDPVFVIGDKVEDIVDGFKGTVVGVTLYLTGCIHFHVEPQVNKDGEQKAPSSLAVQRLKIDESAPKLEFPDGLKTFETPWELGQRVKDKTSGQAGVVVGLTFHETGRGCIHVQLPMVEEGKSAKVIVVAEHALELTGEPAVDLSAVVNSKEPPSPGEYEVPMSSGHH